MRQAVMMNLFDALGLLLLRASQEPNLLVTFGPSYVITRFVMGKVIAGGALLLAHFPFTELKIPVECKAHVNR